MLIQTASAGRCLEFLWIASRCVTTRRVTTIAREFYLLLTGILKATAGWIIAQSIRGAASIGISTTSRFREAWILNGCRRALRCGNKVGFSCSGDRGLFVVRFGRAPNCGELQLPLEWPCSPQAGAW